MLNLYIKDLEGNPVDNCSGFIILESGDGTIRTNLKDKLASNNTINFMDADNIELDLASLARITVIIKKAGYLPASYELKPGSQDISLQITLEKDLVYNNEYKTVFDTSGKSLNEIYDKVKYYHRKTKLKNIYNSPFRRLR